MFKRKQLLRVTLMLPMFFFSLWSFGQTTTIRGTVKDETGTTLPGVSVVVKETKKATITDGNGNYSITAPSDAKKLSFSFVGMSPQEIDIEGKTLIDVVLQEDIIGLGEIIVVGYGTQRKEAVTGSVTSMKGDELRDVPSSNISQALQGRIAGVEMTQTSSKPGAEMQIRIRGTRSLNASNDPLVVLDGIPFAGSIGDINPSSIKSIDILKDASATAIYGSRGANGVLLVTTIKGNKGEKAKVSYNGYYGIKKIYAKYPMMNGTEFLQLRKDAGVYVNKDGTLQYGVDEAADVNTDWQDLFYKTGMVTNHDLGISGGTEKGSYNFGAGYYKEESVLPGQDYSRFSLRGSLDQEVGIFRFGFTSNNNYSINNGNNLGIYTTLSSSPIANPYNTDGTLKRTVKMPLDENWVYTKKTIEDLDDSWIDQTKAFGSYNTLYGEMKIPGIDGLKYRVNAGGNFRMSNGGNYTGQGVFATNKTTISTASISNSLTTNWVIENLLTYDRTFAEKHQLNVVAMYSAERTKYNSSSVTAKDIPSDAFQFYNLGRANGEIAANPDNQYFTESGLLSYMGRAMYSYDSRYMMTATFRTDASSRLASGHKYFTYPAVSAGWNINKESFMENISVIDMLKLRVGFGETSNQSVDPYKTLGLLKSRPYNFGNTNTSGLYVSELPNSELGWEFSKTWNYGLDFALLKNRLTGTFEYYVQSTDNVLLGVNLPGTSGVGSYMANIGKTENKGFEFSLNGVILDNFNGVTWEAGFNIYSNHNKLVSLASGSQSDKGNSWFVGSPINVVYDYEKIGLWQEGEPVADYEGKAGNVGMIKVKYTGTFDAAGKPTRLIGEDDRQIINLESNFAGGFNSRIAYKGFDLSIVGAFQSGGVLISTLYGSSSYLNMMTGRRGNVKVDYWTPTNTDAKYPKPGGIGGDNPKYGTTLGYFDASYVKIRTISLGYNINKNWIGNTGIESLRVYCTVQNPFVMFSPYHDESGMDPETNSYGNENQAVNSTYKKSQLTIGTNTPSTTNYLIGFNLSF